MRPPTPPACASCTTRCRSPSPPTRPGTPAENLLATGAFVVNLPSYERDILEKVRVVGLPFARGVNELEKAGLTALPSTIVKPPRIAECLRHFECEVVWTKEWIKRMMVVGNVVAASTYSDCVDAKGYIVWERVKPVAFCGAPYVNMFAAAHETMEVGMPYDGPGGGRRRPQRAQLFRGHVSCPLCPCRTRKFGLRGLGNCTVGNRRILSHGDAFYT